MEEKEPIASQPQSVSSCDGIVKGKCVQLLENTDRLIIQRRVQDSEAWHSPNTYCIATDEKSLDNPLLMVNEEASNNMVLKALFCCNQRECDLRVTDSSGTTIMWLEHPKNCNWPILCPSCTPGMIVRSSSGRILGYVNHSPRDTCGSCLPPSLYYDVHDSENRQLLKIEGPACKFECCTTTTFRIFSSKWNSYIGEIGHEWQGTCDGIFSCCVSPDTDKTTMTFPREMGANEKALLLGALVLAHLNYFEQM
ncbi:phospholipid scramblase 2-like [Rhopilema esculentum]|uniref:phospholipid scramblase 2-like n=1 Tax=Rhopilema esculentum TaxID=499914 RepID=UPI0031DE43AA